MRVANVRLFWVRSPSADVSRSQLVLNVNGTETVVDMGPDVQEFVMDVTAQSNVRFRIDVWDAEGQKASSAEFAFTLGDLETPIPPSGLGMEILSVRDDGPPNGDVGDQPAAARRSAK